MEIILSYLDNMFFNMPKTPEVLRAKEELASMMEDKYNELLARGKKENEAVGIVISEFGDLEELAEELGLGKKSQDSSNYGEAAHNGAAGSYGTSENYGAAGSYGASENYGAAGSYGASENYGAAGNYGTSEGYGTAGNQETTDYGSPVRMVSREEAEEYLYSSRKTSRWIAVGVMLCIYCPIFLILCGGINDYIKKLSDGQIVCFGLVPLFIMIGIAVSIFIYNGLEMEKFEYLKKEEFQLEPELKFELEQMKQEENSKSAVWIIIGVVMCIFSIIPLLVSGSVTENEFVQMMSVIFMLMVIGGAVVLFIIGGINIESIKVLCQEGEFSFKAKEGSKVAEVIAGVYWPVITVIYLVWSFSTMQWGFTWIIWPVAGIIFAGIEAICKTVGAYVL